MHGVREEWPRIYMVPIPNAALVPYVHTLDAVQAIPSVRIHSATSFPRTGQHMENRTEQSHTDSAGGSRNVVALASILDAVRHPWDANSILEWAIMLWESDPGMDLLVITELGDARPMDNRLRVKLASVKKELGSGFKQFGFTTTYFGWTLLDGTEREALVLSRKVHRRHTALEAFDAVFGAKKS
jgi:hypothetical protein